MTNVVGSNIFNVLVVLGASAVVLPLRVKSRLVRRDVPLLLGVSMATWGMASGGRLTWIVGLALLTGMALNLVWEARTASEEVEDGDLSDEALIPWPMAAAKLAAGLALLVLGSQVLVSGAISAAQGLGVSEAVIGLTIVSAGTSMPELVTSLVAAYRGKADLAIGNVVGSNLLNQLLILGTCSLLSGPEGIEVSGLLITRDFPIMVATTLACLPIFWSGGVISRTEGWVLLGLYGLFLAEQIMHTTAFSGLDQFRFVVLAAVVPLVMVFVVWNALEWRQARLRSH